MTLRRTPLTESFPKKLDPDEHMGLSYDPRSASSKYSDPDHSRVSGKLSRDDDEEETFSPDSKHMYSDIHGKKRYKTEYDDKIEWVNEIDHNNRLMYKTLPKSEETDKFYINENQILIIKEFISVYEDTPVFDTLNEELKERSFNTYVKTLMTEINTSIKQMKSMYKTVTKTREELLDNFSIPKNTSKYTSNSLSLEIDDNRTKFMGSLTLFKKNLTQQFGIVSPNNTIIDAFLKNMVIDGNTNFYYIDTIVRLTIMLLFVRMYYPSCDKQLNDMTKSYTEFIEEMYKNINKCILYEASLSIAEVYKDVLGTIETNLNNIYILVYCLNLTSPGDVKYIDIPEKDILDFKQMIKKLHRKQFDYEISQYTFLSDIVESYKSSELNDYAKDLVIKKATKTALTNLFEFYEQTGVTPLTELERAPDHHDRPRSDEEDSKLDEHILDSRKSIYVVKKVIRDMRGAIVRAIGDAVPCMPTKWKGKKTYNLFNENQIGGLATNETPPLQVYDTYTFGYLFSRLMDFPDLNSVPNTALESSIFVSMNLVRNSGHPMIGAAVLKASIFTTISTNISTITREITIPTNEYSKEFILLIKTYIDTPSTDVVKILIGGLTMIGLFEWFNSSCGKTWLRIKFLNKPFYEHVKNILTKFKTIYQTTDLINNAIRAQFTARTLGLVVKRLYQDPSHNNTTPLVNDEMLFRIYNHMIFYYGEFCYNTVQLLDTFLNNFLTINVQNSSIIMLDITTSNATQTLRSSVNFTDDIINNYTKKLKRFDEAILYFSISGDERVRLLFDLICLNNIDFNNIDLNITRNMNAPNMAKSSFVNQMKNITSNVHYEWVLFIFYISVYLQNYNDNIPDEYKKLLLKLANPQTPTMHIVKGIYDKIATFKIKGDSTEKRFIQDATDIKNIESITFRSTIDIYNLFLGTCVNSYEELLYSLLYINKTGKSDVRVEYNMKLYKNINNNILTINTRINNINNLMLTLYSYKTYHITYDLTVKSDYVKTLINNIKINSINLINKSIPELYKLPVLHAAIIAHLNTINIHTRGITPSQEDEVKTLVESMFTNDSMIIKNIPMYLLCLMVLIRFFKLDNNQRDAHYTVIAPIVINDVNYSELIVSIDNIKTFSKGLYPDNDIPDIPFIINLNPHYTDETFFTDVITCIDSMNANINSYYHCIKHPNTATYEEANKSEEINFKYFCNIVEKFKNTYMSEISTDPSHLIYTPNPLEFEFGKLDIEHPNKYLKYHNITTLAKEPGGILHPNDYTELDSYSKYYNIDIRNILYKNGTAITIDVPDIHKNFEDFHFMIPNPLSVISYDNHKKFINAITKNKNELPYIPIILDNGKNKSSKYDTRLIDNLKLYLKLIFDHASTYKFFNYNFIKYYGHSIMQQSTVIAQTQERIQVKQHRIFSLTYGQIMNQKNRDKIYNKDGILMQKDSKNKDVDVSVKSEGFIALLKEEAKCLGTGFTAADIIVNGEKQNYICNTYIMQCLYGTGIEKCKIFLQHPEFWENAVKEVKNMFPVIMVSTLKAFGLITVRRKDPVTKSELIFSESINDWFTRLQGFVNNPDLNIITASELKAIYENKQLVAYINEIILRVNFNPSILNINYVPKKSNKNILKRIKQAKGMLPQYNPFNTGILRRMRYITFSSSFDEQVGGDPNRNYSIKDTYLDTLNPANTRKLSKVFSVILINLIQQLKSNNKSIDDEDKSKFIGLIKETEEIEKNLSKVMNIFKNYIRYMALNPDNTPETISYDDMENTDIVPVKQRHKVAIIKYPMLSAGILQKRIYADGRTLNKKRNVVIEALQLLEDAVENSSKKGYKEQVVIKPLLGSVVSLSVEPHVDADMWPAR